MKKNTHYFVLSFGLFLGWLLSFLYNGPALEIIFANGNVNIKYLAIAYILTPSLLSFYLGFFNLNENYRALFIRSAIYVNLAGTLLAITLNMLFCSTAVYILAGIMGIFSVLYIAGWGCYFARSVSIKVMYKYMAYAICLGNIIFHTNEVLKAQSYHGMVIALLLASLLGSYFASKKLISEYGILKSQYSFQLPKDLLAMMCFLMFLLNVGGGVVQTLISPLAENSYRLVHGIDIMIYLVLGLVIFKTKKSLPSDILLIISIVIIASGYLTLIMIAGNPLPAYALLVVGYAALDIFIWTMVAKLGHIYGQPLKVFLLIMAANLLAVFMGNTLGAMLNSTLQDLYLTIALSALSTILAFAFVPFINKFLQQGMLQLEQHRAQEEALKGVVAVAKATELLTPKELDIYKFMLLNLKNKEIAVKAKISDNTLKGHARSIYKKFGVSNKKELLERANKGGL